MKNNYRLAISVLILTLITGCAAPIVRDIHKPSSKRTDCSLPTMMAYAGDLDKLYFEGIDKRYLNGELLITRNRYVRGQDNFELARNEIISCSKQGYYKVSEIEKLVLSCADNFTIYKTPIYSKYLNPKYTSPIDPRFVHDIHCSKAGLDNANDALEIYKNSTWLRNHVRDYHSQRVTDDIKFIEITLVKHDIFEEERLAYFKKVIDTHGFIKAMNLYKNLLSSAGIHDSEKEISKILEKITKGNLGTYFFKYIKNEAEYNFVRSTVMDKDVLKKFETDIFNGFEKAWHSFSNESKVRIIESAIEIEGIKKVEVYANTPSRLHFINENIKDLKALRDFNYYFYRYHETEFKNLNDVTKVSFIDLLIESFSENAKSKNEIVRMDYISTGFSNNYKAGRHLGVIVYAEVLRNYNKMNKPSLSLFEAEAYYELGFRSKAKSLIDNWLATYGKKNKWYRKVLELYSKL